MIRFFATHPTAANLLMIGLMAVGLFAAPLVKRETFPDIPAEKVEVRAVYPGASTEVVEEALCQRIEDAVDGIDNLVEKVCEAREGLAIATLEMREGADMSRFLDDIKSEVDAIDAFPEDVKRPTTHQLERTDFVAAVAITGPENPSDLKAYAEEVKDRLLLISGVATIRVEGFSDHQIRIEVPDATLRQYGLSVDDLAHTVENQSVDQPIGSVESADGTVLIRFTDKRRRPSEFEDLVVVAAKSGAEVRLGNIAVITDRFELDEEKSIFNGKRSAYLRVNKGRGDDTLFVVDALKTAIERERAMAPPTMTFAVTQDVSSIVRDRINMLLRNGAQGLVLVFLTMWAFFSLRYSFWIAMGLPVSFLGAIAMMAAFDYSFDMISIVGLLIGVGLLMDDAIVISESIATHRRDGKDPIDAAVDGTKQVLPGVVSSFLTTVCVFGGLAFMTGHIGAILKVMPVILIMVLSVSLIEAFLILPHHLSRSLIKGEKPPSPLRIRFEAVIEWMRERIVGRLVDLAVEWRYLTLGLVISALLVSVSMVAGGVLKFRAFPDMEGDVVEARILLPQGTPLARTEAVVQQTLDALDQVQEEFRPRQTGEQDLIRNIGVQYSVNLDAFETGPHVATIGVDLLPSENRSAPIDEVLNRWRELSQGIPDVINIKFAERVIGPAGLPIDMRLKGPDLDDLKQAALELRSWLEGYAGVQDLSDDLRPGKPEMRVKIREGAKVLGLDAASVAAQLSSAFQGRKADEIQAGPEAYEIEIRLTEADRNSLADLDYFTVTLADGNQVPLGAVATVEPGRGFARIKRVDGQRTVTIQGQVDSRVANAAAIGFHTTARFLPELEKRHPGVTVSFQGQAKETSKTGDSLRRNFLLGLLGVFLILSFQFRSYIEPIIVMTVIPLALIGVVFGHLLMGYEISMPSLVGTISLAGVVVNDSILLVHFIKARRRAGETVRDATRGASRQRFRAILLTSLTTMAGLLPLLTETSLQAQVLAPLVTSLAFGLFTATALLLFVVPVLYAILNDFGLGEKIEMDEPMPDAEPPPPKAGLSGRRAGKAPG